MKLKGDSTDGQTVAEPKASPFKEATLHGHSSEVETLAVSNDGELI